MEVCFVFCCVFRWCFKDSWDLEQATKGDPRCWLFAVVVLMYYLVLLDFILKGLSSRPLDYFYFCRFLKP